MKKPTSQSLDFSLTFGVGSFPLSIILYSQRYKQKHYLLLVKSLNIIFKVIIKSIIHHLQQEGQAL